MHPRDALNQTILKYKLKAVEISRLSGIAPDELSRFRRGKKDMLSANLMKVVRALPSEAQVYFLLLLSPYAVSA